MKALITFSFATHRRFRRPNVLTCFGAATLGLFFALTFFASASTLTVTNLPPFTGSHSETWEEFGGGALPSGTSILGGIATIAGTNMVTAHTFQMCSVFGSPSDGFFFMDQDRPHDLVTISFAQPVLAFGAYWGSGVDCKSCCGFNDAPSVLTFKDANGNVVGSDSFFYTGGGDLEWHGYAFSTPVKTIIRTAGDGKEGVATDGMQVTASNALKISSIMRSGANAFHLNCVGVPNVLNRIEWSPDLSPGSFNTLVSRMANAIGAFQYDDTSADTKKFYRVAYP